MQVIIPMAGRGSRFIRAGYQAVKPLIEVDGRPIIEHIINLFPGDHDFLFICATDHLESTPLEKTLKRLVPRGKIVGIAPHKLGPVHTALEAKSYIRDDQPVVLSYCDYSLFWNFQAFESFVRETGCDGCIPSYKGFHPHSLGPNYYGYLRMQGDRVQEIKEKASFTNDKMQEFASAGTYYFKTGSILKTFFQKAVEADLRASGEFFASLPYNLMIAEKKDVRVFEVEHFLQWGTPEDLREYQHWSDYFARYAAWKPALGKQKGLTLLPMAGEGQRFRQVGFETPKPLIPVDGEAMIGRTLASLPETERTITVSLEPVARALNSKLGLRSIGRDFKTIALSGPTEGAVCTCLAAEDQIDPEAPLLIAACDAALIYDDARFEALTRDPKVDFLAWTFRDHAHANRNPKQYAWVKASAGGSIEKILCKVPLREGDVHEDPGITGAFWFRKGRYFLEAAREVLAKGERVNREFYVDTVVGRLPEKGLRGQILETRHFICFGTPDDLRTYEYWAAYFRKTALAQNQTTKVATKRK